MKIFKSEVKDGLAEEIQAKASIAFASTAIIVEDLFADTIRSYASDDLIANICEQKDLAPIKSVLVSTGWNANTDIFTKYEAWAARNTPCNKQVNLNHSDKLIGHMVASSVYDFDRNLIPDETDFEDVPDNFDIITAAVLYKKHPNEQLRKAVAELIPKIANGEAYVSMECFFNDFDYGLKNADGDSRIVARNEDTAWLTKHLRQFGGSGEYNGYTLGRVIKNLSFSGKGIVDNPANKRSIIFSNMQTFSNATVVENTDFISAENTQTEEEVNMPDTVSIEVHEALKAELAKFQKERDEHIKAQLADHIQTIAELNDKVKSMESELSSAQAELEATKNEYEESAQAAKKEFVAKVEELDAANQKLETIEAKAMRVERIGKLISVGESEESAAEIADEWVGASDEQFDKIVKMHGDINESQAKLAQASEESDEEEASAGLNVEEENEADPVVDDETANEQTVAFASDFLSQLMSK